MQRQRNGNDVGVTMEIFLASAQGFCSGVANAIRIVEKAILQHGVPLYVYHEIVHNTHIINDFRKRGVIFVEDINAVPPGNVLVFSAHGVPPSVYEAAKVRNLKCIDATCPLVKKVHDDAANFSKKGYHVILIGHKGHQEVIGTVGYVRAELLHIVEKENEVAQLNIDPQTPVAYLTQTTLSLDETSGIVERLKIRFPRLSDPRRSDICFATQKRQDAIKELAKVVDIIIVCGSPNSSNSNRLRETGERQGIPSVIIDAADELNMGLLKDKKKIGISSGASVPSFIVEDLVKKIQTAFPGTKVSPWPN